MLRNDTSSLRRLGNAAFCLRSECPKPKIGRTSRELLKTGGKGEGEETRSACSTRPACWRCTKMARTNG